MVGYAKTSSDLADGTVVIGFDTRGTSTDVSRYAGEYEHVFESTVAAGGGSVLFWNGLFIVGPESAQARPGPTSYRKGGPLTITDANLFLGRLLPDHFSRIFGSTEDQPLDLEIVTQKFWDLIGSRNYLGRDADNYHPARRHCQCH